MAGDGQFAVASKALGAVAGESTDDAGGGDNADPVVAGVGDVEVAKRVGGEPLDGNQLGFGGEAEVAGFVAAGNRGDGEAGRLRAASRTGRPRRA